MGFVRDEQNQMIFGNAFQQIHNHDGVCFVEIARRLVCEDDTRVFDDGAGNGDTLLLSSRKGAGRTLCVFFHTDVFECCHHAALDFVRVGHAAKTERGGDVIETRFLFVEVVILKDIADITVAQIVSVRTDIVIFDRDGAGGEIVQTADDVQKRGFTATAFSENGGHTAFGKLKVDTVNDVDFILVSFVEIFMQILNADHCALSPFRDFFTLSPKRRRTCFRVIMTVSRIIPKAITAYCQA